MVSARLGERCGSGIDFDGLTRSARCSRHGTARRVRLGCDRRRIGRKERRPSRRVNTLGVGTYVLNGMVRSSDGTLHLIYQTTTGSSYSPTGLGTISISTAGNVGTETAALKGWNTSIPGLVGLPNGGPRGGLRLDLAAESGSGQRALGDHVDRRRCNLVRTLPGRHPRPRRGALLRGQRNGTAQRHDTRRHALGRRGSRYAEGPRPGQPDRLAHGQLERRLR